MNPLVYPPPPPGQEDCEAPGVPLLAGFIPVTAVDVPVRTLVRRLNRLAGVSTVSSCGGHPRPRPGSAQVPEGHFYVDLDIEPTEDGWRSLAVLAWLCDPSTGTVLTPWSEGPDEAGDIGARFSLQGTHLAGLTLEANLLEYFTRRRGRP